MVCGKCLRWTKKKNKWIFAHITHLFNHTFARTLVLLDFVEKIDYILDHESHFEFVVQCRWLFERVECWWNRRELSILVRQAPKWFWRQSIDGRYTTGERLAIGPQQSSKTLFGRVYFSWYYDEYKRENRTEYEVNILSLGDDMAEFIGHFFICCYTHCACVVVCTRVNSIQMGYEFINYIHCVNIGIFL